MARDPVWRQAAPGYLGMVRESASLRVIVAESNRGAGPYYRLQVPGHQFGRDGSPEWVPVAASSSSSLGHLLRKCGASWPGLSELVEGLPEDPAKAAPWFWAFRADDDGRWLGA